MAINLRNVMCQESVEDAKKFGNETQLLAKVVQKLAVIRALATDLGHRAVPVEVCRMVLSRMWIDVDSIFSTFLEISQLFLNS